MGSISSKKHEVAIWYLPTQLKELKQVTFISHFQLQESPTPANSDSHPKKVGFAKTYNRTLSCRQIASLAGNVVAKTALVLEFTPFGILLRQCLRTLAA